MSDFISGIGFIILVILIIALAGFLNIWALNTLFPSLSIPYNIWTWSASTILFANLSRIKKVKSNVD